MCMCSRANHTNKTRRMLSADSIIPQFRSQFAYVAFHPFTTLDEGHMISSCWSARPNHCVLCVVGRTNWIHAFQFEIWANGMPHTRNENYIIQTRRSPTPIAPVVHSGIHTKCTNVGWYVFPFWYKLFVSFVTLIVAIIIIILLVVSRLRLVKLIVAWNFLWRADTVDTRHSNNFRRIECANFLAYHRREIYFSLPTELWHFCSL